MKEVTYEDWQKNPTTRMMWVWDDDVKDKVKRKVVCVLSGAEGRKCNVITLHTFESCFRAFKHCAEIEKSRRMTNKELSWWLTEKPHREFKSDDWIFSRHYYLEENQFQEVKDVLIREDGGEWREPLVEVEE